MRLLRAIFLQHSLAFVSVYGAQGPGLKECLAADAARRQGLLQPSLAVTNRDTLSTRRPAAGETSGGYTGRSGLADQLLASHRTGGLRTSRAAEQRPPVASSQLHKTATGLHSVMQTLNIVQMRYAQVVWHLQAT